MTFRYRKVNAELLDNIKEVRAREKKTYVELGKQFGLGCSTIAYWLGIKRNIYGENNPNWKGIVENLRKKKNFGRIRQ